jgi:hypothetical protein
MTKTSENARRQTEPSSYEIHVREPIDPHWVVLYEGMTISQGKNGETIIFGPIMDKSALHGLLAMIGELNLTLLSVKKIDSLDLPTGGNHEK